ncbi:MAG TPA: YbhB/YbcL family Raf kinase inhibitor-like protein [Gammaproteobacteria bacterium]|jgi:Raf kinase inhibitor-like YbhB/YbcL family protein
MNIRGLSLAFMLGAGIVAGLGAAVAQPPLPRFMIQSNAFEDGGVVPERFAFRGDNVQPDFAFSGLPENAASVAIIFHDLDVALNGSTDDVLHWLAWNIPAAAGGIPEGNLPEGSVSGTNLMGQTSYFGPGAPAGERYHHYVFEFYALSENLELDSSAGRAELLEAMNGKVVAKAAYVGRYRGSE